MSPRPIDLEAILSQAQLPALPQSAIRLLAWSNESEIDPLAFAAPIEADPGMTGQVLRFVNSSYFGFAREVSNVKLGITLVGARTIKNFVLWSAVFSLMPNPDCGAFDLPSLWRDSLRRGLFARGYARMMQLPDTEESFVAALLQDMGLPLLVKALPDEYASLLEARQSTGRRLSELELERFGWTHADAGASIARRWSLPDGLAELLANHTRGDALCDPDGPVGSQVAVTLSSLLPATRDKAWTERDAFDAAYRAHVPSDAPEALHVLAGVDDAYCELAPAMKLAGPTTPLARLYEHAPSLAGS